VGGWHRYLHRRCHHCRAIGRLALSLASWCVIRTRPLGSGPHLIPTFSLPLPITSGTGNVALPPLQGRQHQGKRLASNRALLPHTKMQNTLLPTGGGFQAPRQFSKATSISWTRCGPIGMSMAPKCVLLEARQEFAWTRKDSFHERLYLLSLD
jgi:hypothetical protein